MPNPFWCSYTILLSRATLFSLVFNNSKTPSTHCYYIARLAEWRSRSDTSKAFHVSSSQWACGSDSKSPRGLGQQITKRIQETFLFIIFLWDQSAYTWDALQEQQTRLPTLSPSCTGFLISSIHDWNCNYISGLPKLLSGLYFSSHRG